MTGARWRLAVVAATTVGLLTGGWAVLEARSSNPLPRGVLRLSSGARQGVYSAVADELASRLHDRDPHLQVSVETSSGSLQNLDRIATAQADCAIAAGDAVAADPTQLHGPGNRQIRAVARIYDDYLQLVVRSDRGVNTLEDIRGKTISLGALGSGVRLVTERLLQASGLSDSSLRSRDLGIDQSLVALADGTIDGFFWSGGLPTPAVVRLAQRTPSKLVPLGDRADAMVERYGSVYRSAIIPAHTYGNADPISTVALPNMVVCAAGVPADVVEFLLDTLFRDRSEIARAVPAFSVLDRRAAIATDPVPLHPGALRWYRRTKS